MRHYLTVTVALILGTLLVGCTFGARAGAVTDRTPPGVEAYGDQLARELHASYRSLGKQYVPRTHHHREDGSPRYINRLILEGSPYLRQHAHNPVNWYPWGEEAFAEARRSGRPILLSIGYSTCHWCHVMERESFEDEEIATYMNEHYVAIKVDREERPDLDAVYMSAVQMLTGRGGWPMTTWLTPDAEPFYGGTYFPARDGDRGTRQGFLTLLRELRAAYDEKPETIARQAKQITFRLQAALGPGETGDLPDVDVLDTVMQRYKSSFDPVNGGMRRQPKFPSSLSVRLLLSQYRRSGDPELLDMASLTLTRMARGGIYDQIGGGFHRYSTDSKWLVPHFEKMLYDNALLTLAYLEGYQATGNAEFADVARDILRYVSREMTSPDGVFFSATDADSLTPSGEMEEGWFFTWTQAELDALLDPPAARHVKAFYGVSSQGNFEGRTIFHVSRSIEKVAPLLGTSVEKLRQSLDQSREILYRARSKRPAPLRDDKILTSWNGLMISAMARGSFVLDEPEFLRRAETAAAFLLEHVREEGRLLRSYKDRTARHNAYLDDYAFLVAGLLDLYECGSDPRWLKEALALQEVLDRHYADRTNGGYFMTSDDHEKLLAREKPFHDGAEPSGNSVALMNLVRLHELTTDDRFRARAEALLRGFAPALERRGEAASELLLALDFRLGRPKEIVLASSGLRKETKAFLDVLRREYLPAKVLVVVPDGRAGRAHTDLIPLAEGKVAREGKTTAYVCERGVCKLPTDDVELFRRQLLDAPPPAAGG